LSNEYKDTTFKIGKWLKIYLPFSNPEEVVDCFEINFISNMLQNCELSKFTGYIFDIYVCDNAIYPHMWALCSATMT